MCFTFSEFNSRIVAEKIIIEGNVMEKIISNSENETKLIGKKFAESLKKVTL